jgi:hypothetical protein
MFDVQEAIDNFDSLNGSVVRTDRVTRAKPGLELCNTPSASTIETLKLVYPQRISTLHKETTTCAEEIQVSVPQHNCEYLTRDIGHEEPPAHSVKGKYFLRTPRCTLAA